MSDASKTRSVLDGEAPADYLAAWTKHFALPKAQAPTDTESVVIFRIAQEWFALSTASVRQVVGVRPIHSLPHRAGSAALGLVNVRGELLACISLTRLLNLEAEPDGTSASGTSRRLLVMQRNAVRAVCVADEVDGIRRVRTSEMKGVPATVARGGASHFRGVLTSPERSIGVLDDSRLFPAIQRSLA